MSPNIASDLNNNKGQHDTAVLEKAHQSKKYDKAEVPSASANAGGSSGKPSHVEPRAELQPPIKVTTAEDIMAGRLVLPNPTRLFSIRESSSDISIPGGNGSATTAPVIVTPETKRKPATASTTIAEDTSEPPPYQAKDKNVTEAISEYVSNEERNRILRAYAEYIYKKADDDKDGVLNEWEFSALVQSPTLGLNIDDDEAREMFEENSDSLEGGLSFKNFMPILKDLMVRHSLAKQEHNNSDGWQWFTLLFEENADLLPVYYNTVDDVMTYSKPPGVSDERDLSSQNFENLNVEGTILTTFINDFGQRMYLDFESSEWKLFPAAWYPLIIHDEVLEGTQESRPLMNVDSLERCRHPITDVEFESYIEDGCRFFFNEDVGEWVPIPLSLEIHVPRVVEELAMIADAIPSWKNKREQLLALRQNGYDVDATIEWKVAEMSAAAKYGDIMVEEPATTKPRPKSAAQRDIAAVQEKLVQEVEGTWISKLAEVKEHAAKELSTATLRYEEERHQWDRERATAQHDYQMLENRVLDLEKQAANDAIQAAENATKAMTEYEARLASLHQELNALREGDDLKATVIERDQQIDVLREKITETTIGLQTTKKLVEVSCSRAQFEIQTLRAKQEGLKQFFVESLVPKVHAMIQESLAGIMKRSETIVEEATKTLLAKYRFEVQQRKILYNKLQELKGNIRVFCRVRKDDRVKCILEFPDIKSLGTPIEIAVPATKENPEKRKFEFDRVYSPTSTQEDVFSDTDAIMTSCVDGYNVCIMAYGQTGSGKTHTMMGTEDNPGVNRRAVKELMRVLALREEVEYSITLSLMEIYNEKIVDLLSSGSLDRVTCDIRQDPVTKLPYVSNLTQRKVTTVDDVVQTLAEGDANRSVAATAMNSQSSRSHLLLQIGVTSRNTITGVTSTGKLTLVDLAGSERVSKTEATGQRLVEAAAINKSLSALGQVFAALRQGQQHVPYRNSKLTHVLQDSLGGDAKTCIFINISPAESNLAETIGTLKFGQAIRTIELKPGAKKPAPGKAAPPSTQAQEAEE